MPDTMQIEILEDGTISVSTDKISGQNHVSADEFLLEIEKLTGGERVVTKKKNKFAHQAHNHGSFAHSHG